MQDYPSLQEMQDEDALALCQHLRARLLEVVSQTGGHLASNLGIVELTVALHRVYDTKTDRLLFDVGHQCYIHKMLTGRNAQMESIRQFGGLAGFPKPVESPHDAFIAGHASAAVSTALGMALARSRLGKEYHVIALLGDGALTGGLAYEGLSTAGQSGEKMLIILNDNGMSITRNVSGVGKHLAKQRLKPQYLRLKTAYRRLMRATCLGRGFYKLTHKLKAGIKAALLPASFFEDMGFTYLGPVDGHDLPTLTRVLQQAKDCTSPVLLHVKTVKGKGYAPAEQNPDAFHGVAPFHIADGAPKMPPSGQNFSQVFGDTLCRLAEDNPKIFALTAAMSTGTGLADFAQRFPERFFDVGIAEGNAVTIAGGLAKQGMRPVFAVYSTFLQRSYDMLLHDIAIQNLPLVLGIDRAGLVGDDGETHHGLYDYAFLRTIPHMHIFAPSSYAELSSMLEASLSQDKHPVALRYPRGTEGAFQGDSSTRAEVYLRRGCDLTLVGYGMMINSLLAVAEALSAEGIEAEVVKINQIYPLEGSVLFESVRNTQRVLFAEEVVGLGCLGEHSLSRLMQAGIFPTACVLCHCGTGFVPHGKPSQLHKLCGLDVASLIKKAKELCTDGGKKTSGCSDA